MAKAVTEQCGPQHTVCTVTSRLAEVHEEKGMEAAHKVFQKTKLTFDVPISTLPKECGRISCIYMTDMVEAMVKHKCADRLYGGIDVSELPQTLLEFWSKLRPLRESFEVFDKFDSGECNPAFCIPVYTHGDEGRGRQMLFG
jgi:hypothetical protein